MKRTNLIVDEKLLQEAKQLFGTDSLSATVNKALAESIKAHRVRGLADFFGSGAWDGDLASMRQDAVSVKPRRSKA